MKLIDVSTPKHPNTFTMVDDADFDWLNQWRWRAALSGSNLYAHRDEIHPTHKIILMHRQIIQPPNHMVIDHADRNGLNNQKLNLRTCSYSQNLCNKGKRKDGVTSKYIGVCFDKSKNRYLAQVHVNKKTVFKKHFNTEIEAAKARDEMAKFHHGEFAVINFQSQEENFL